jgi:hypothetical protein
MDKQFSTFIPATVLISFLYFFEVLQKPASLTVVIQLVSYEVKRSEGKSWMEAILYT